MVYPYHFDLLLLGFLQFITIIIAKIQINLYDRRMKKWISLILTAAFLVSIFDIVDVSDITLNGKGIFTNGDTCANQNNDDLSNEDFNFSKILIFNLAESADFQFQYACPQAHPRIFRKQPLYEAYAHGLYRPPII